MDWLFSGLGTFIVGLLIGGGAGTAVTRVYFLRRTSTRQSQTAGDSSQQNQVGGDVNNQR